MKNSFCPPKSLNVQGRLLMSSPFEYRVWACVAIVEPLFCSLKPQQDTDRVINANGIAIAIPVLYSLINLKPHIVLDSKPHPFAYSKPNPNPQSHSYPIPIRIHITDIVLLRVPNVDQHAIPHSKLHHFAHCKCNENTYPNFDPIPIPNYVNNPL